MVGKYIMMGCAAISKPVQHRKRNAKGDSMRKTTERVDSRWVRGSPANETTIRKTCRQIEAKGERRHLAF